MVSGGLIWFQIEIYMNDTDVVNLALTKIGIQGSVSSINPSDGSTEGDAASILYEPLMNSLHRAANWNFARKQDYLTLLRAAVINGIQSDNPPPQPWFYEYLYPADCLRARFIIPYFASNSNVSPPLTTSETVIPNLFEGPPIKFVVGNDRDLHGNPTRVILTEMQNAILVYTARITDPTQWDPNFLDAATNYLGAWLINALSRNRAQLNDMVAATKEIIATARTTDGDEGITSADHLPDWIAVRGFSGDFIGRTSWLQTWDLIGFPGGLSF